MKKYGYLNRHRSLSLLAAIPLLTLSGIGVAQETAEADTSRLEEIVVTARKRKESIQDVPVGRHR